MLGIMAFLALQMDHLACFLPANLALGVAEGAVQGAKAALYAEVAANLTYTCWQMCAHTPTGAHSRSCQCPPYHTIHPKLPIPPSSPSNCQNLRCSFCAWPACKHTCLPGTTWDSEVNLHVELQAWRRRPSPLTLSAA